MAPPRWRVLREKTQELLDAGIIEKCWSPWSSAPVLVKKSDGSFRLCLDYRDVNKLTKKWVYANPSIDGMLNRMRGATFISKIDLNSAYFQIELEDSSKEISAFSVEGMGQFQFTRMSFGLTNAPSEFQALIERLFGPEYAPYVGAYLDDIYVATANFNDHLYWLRKVIETLLKAGLTPNRKKCEFCLPSVIYLGFRVDKEGLRPDEDRIKPIIEFPAPKNIKELRRFLGSIGWYARFIDHVADLKIPLVKLLHKNVDWHWGPEQQESFLALKKALMTSPVLAQPNFSLPFTIQCDASNNAISGVLTQVHEDGEHPIAYVSRVLTETERRYTVSEKECLACKFSILKFRPYVEGSKFKLITDHSSLRWLHNLKDPNGRLARWALELQQWDFTVEYRKGSLNDLPDMLSRYQEVASIDECRDEWYEQRIKDVQNFPWRFPDWKVENNLLYIHRRDYLLDPVVDNEIGWRLVVPNFNKVKVLNECHIPPSSGHLGIDKTFGLVSRNYWWPSIYHDTREFVRTCPECQRHKSVQTGPQGLMGRRIVERPWVVVAADCMELVPSKNRYTHLLVFQDLFTRWVELIPLRSANGKNVARAFEDLILFRWDTPYYVLTDHGSEFDNSTVRSTLNEYGIKLIHTPPYFPSANVVERSNRIIKTLIRIYVGKDHRDWDKYLPEFRYAINTATQSTTKVSPAFLNFGRHPRPVKNLRRDLENNQLLPVEVSDPELWSERIKKLNYLHDFVIKHLFEAHKTQKNAYDKGRKNIIFKVGDWVLRETKILSNAAKNISAKLVPRYEAPVRIVKVLSPTVYELETNEGYRIPQVHVSRIRPFYFRDSESVETTDSNNLPISENNGSNQTRVAEDHARYSTPGKQKRRIYAGDRYSLRSGFIPGGRTETG